MAGDLTNMQKQYRADIDGLRAIAVLSVVIHHMSYTFLPGGFVGVDIFFVISGFLITSQIYGEIKVGVFSIRSFYKRRINRIVPALAAMIFICLFVGIFLLSPADMVRLTSSASLSLIGVSNFYFWKEYGNYFAADSSEAILLHTWSLGVEEQFYFIWPIFLLLLIRLISRNLLYILMAVVLISFLVSEYAVGRFASASYYLLPTRFFELMIGGVLAIIVDHKWLPTSFYSSLCKNIGFLLIAGSLFLLNRMSSFPGINALFPCLGAALLIWAGSGNRASFVLTNRVSVFIGLISYSLYLWHWPIIAYFHYVDIYINFTVGLLIVAMSFMLAWLSWKYVELPFRRKGAVMPFGWVFTRRLVVPVALLFFMGIISIQYDGFPQRFSPVVSSLEKMAAMKPDEIRNRCHMPNSRYHQKPSPDCVLGAQKENADGILIGDSYANHFTGMVDVLAKAGDIMIMDYTMDGCPPILNYSGIKSLSYAERCALRNQYIVKLINEKHYHYVILAASWPATEESRNAIEATLNRLVESTAQVIIILKNQTIAKAVTCPIRGLMYNSLTNCSTAQERAPQYWEYIQRRFPQVKFLDPNKAICPNQVCNPIIDGILIYRDSGHLNDAGSRLIGRILLEEGQSLEREPSMKNTTVNPG